MPISDADAFWLFDGKADKETQAAVTTKPKDYPKYGRFITERVDDGAEDIGLYVASCQDCEWVSPRRGQDLLLDLRLEHARSHSS